MKKVFWGVLLAMAGLPSLLILILGLLPSGNYIWVFGLSTLIAGLGQAVGFYLIMRGSESLPQTRSWYYAGKISKVLCAYNVAITLLQYINQMGWMTIRLPGIVGTILYFVTDMSTFIVMYFCVLGVMELERVARRDLNGRRISSCFNVWVVVRLLASLLWGGLYLIAEGAYIVMLVYYAKAAWAYDGRNPYEQY